MSHSTNFRGTTCTGSARSRQRAKVSSDRSPRMLSSSSDEAIACPFLLVPTGLVRGQGTIAFGRCRHDAIGSAPHVFVSSSRGRSARASYAEHRPPLGTTGLARMLASISVRADCRWLGNVPMTIRFF
ncbi:unnamed protein product [Arabis nemorensis]|uniref:Uncharacterized protein n=1 Tax=Arabis nemorensis TaxID=586526 RepID=A0A565AZX8_9BRAS|nr:unnamed protein product [Arabis nemorensis]